MAEYQVNKGVGRQVEFQGAHVMVLWQSKTLGKCSIAYHRSAYPKGKPDGEYSLPIN